MALDPSAIGAVTEPQLYEWTERDTMLYALGVGAGTEDLSFTTENSHDIAQQVLPTFAVICCTGFAAAGKVGSFNFGLLESSRSAAQQSRHGRFSVAAEPERRMALLVIPSKRATGSYTCSPFARMRKTTAAATP